MRHPSCRVFFHTLFFVQSWKHCTLWYACGLNYFTHFDSSITPNHIVDFVNHFGGSHFYWTSQMMFIFHGSATTFKLIYPIVNSCKHRNRFWECTSVLELGESSLKRCEKCGLDVSILSEDTKNFCNNLRILELSHINSGQIIYKILYILILILFYRGASTMLFLPRLNLFTQSLLVCEQIIPRTTHVIKLMSHCAPPPGPLCSILSYKNLYNFHIILQKWNFIANPIILIK